MAPVNGDPWFNLMVGHWYTSEVDLGVVGAAASKRQMNSAAWHNFSDQLHQQTTTSLSPDVQKGLTADDLREAFTRGAQQASDVGDTNGVISKSCASAHHCASDLNSRLHTIASEGKSQINQIQQSKDLPPIKLGKIVDVVVQRQQEANSAAAPHTQSVFEAMQSILDQRGINMSARQFAQQHGIDTTRMLGSPNKQTITQQVKGLLGEGGPPAAPPPLETKGPFGGKDGEELPHSAPLASPDQAFGGHVPQEVPGAQQQFLPPQALGGRVPQELPMAVRPPTAGGPLSPGGLQTGLPGASSPLPMSGLSNGLPTNAFNPSAMSSLPQPNALAQGLNPLTQGAPMSGALNNVPPVTSPVQPQVPTAPAVPDAGTSAAAAAHAPAFDTPAPVAPPPVASQAPVADSSPTYLAGPAAAAASSPAPVGPLPTYGADIRPPTPTISAPTAPSSPAPISSISSISSSASPASAPVSPSAGAGGIAQPVVRQPTPTSFPHPAPAGIGEQAVAATAGGAAAGAASAAATAKARLQRLVDFVANQEPRLRWAAGEQADGTTVLVTDLASGWIPPDTAIPSVVTLLDPGERRGDIEALLGEVSVSASYTPLHYLPDSADDTEPIVTSIRPRQVPSVDELGWELGQATNWRNGLPQMAHTLAKAASTGTGVVDTEVEFLHQHLEMLRDKVLDSYPDDVDAAVVANWQLLASINSLAAGDTTGANYHFAWFQALNRVP